MALINTHNLISNNPQIAPRYISDQAQAIAHFEDMEMLLGMTMCMHVWGDGTPYTQSADKGISFPNEDEWGIK